MQTGSIRLCQRGVRRSFYTATTFALLIHGFATAGPVLPGVAVDPLIHAWDCAELLAYFVRHSGTLMDDYARLSTLPVPLPEAIRNRLDSVGRLINIYMEISDHLEASPDGNLEGVQPFVIGLQRIADRVATDARGAAWRRLTEAGRFDMLRRIVQEELARAGVPPLGGAAEEIVTRAALDVLNGGERFRRHLLAQAIVPRTRMEMSRIAAAERILRETALLEARNFSPLIDRMASTIPATAVTDYRRTLSRAPRQQIADLWAVVRSFTEGGALPTTVTRSYWGAVRTGSSIVEIHRVTISGPPSRPPLSVYLQITRNGDYAPQVNILGMGNEIFPLQGSAFTNGKGISFAPGTDAAVAALNPTQRANYSQWLRTVLSAGPAAVTRLDTEFPHERGVMNGRFAGYSHAGLDLRGRVVWRLVDGVVQVRYVTGDHTY